MKLFHFLALLAVCIEAGKKAEKKGSAASRVQNPPNYLRSGAERWSGL